MLKAGTASFAALSVTLLAAGSGSQPSTVDGAAQALAQPAYAQRVALVSQALPTGPASPAIAASRSAPRKRPVPAPPRVAAMAPALQPVAGLDQPQMNNAAIIVKQGRAQGMPQQALVVAVATAMQESSLYNVASAAVPSSLNLPHQGLSTDHDSVGLFQQRASQGWGSVAELMNPAHSAMLFFNALSQVEGWQRMSVTAAAQAVQRSAFPGAYQKRVPQAEQVVAALS